MSAVTPSHGDGGGPRTLARRAFLGALAGGALTALAAPGAAQPARQRPIRALALDGFTTFDPRHIAALAERLFPAKGRELFATWRTRQFEYSWLRVVTHRYADFGTVTEEALMFAANAAGVELGEEPRRLLMDGYLRLPPYPDVKPALTVLREAGIRLAFLTNLTPRMLDAAIGNGGLHGLFEHRLSTDAIKSYKPDPRAYQLGVAAFGLAIDEIGFVASAGWDAAGAKSFGYPTFWVNRSGQPVEELGVRPDGIAADLNDVVGFVRSRH
jgi:2-haloacid dehalogenase